MILNIIRSSKNPRSSKPLQKVCLHPPSFPTPASRQPSNRTGFARPRQAPAMPREKPRPATMARPRILEGRRRLTCSGRKGFWDEEKAFRGVQQVLRQMMIQLDHTNHSCSLSMLHPSQVAFGRSKTGLPDKSWLMEPVERIALSRGSSHGAAEGCDGWTEEAAKEKERVGTGLDYWNLAFDEKCGFVLRNWIVAVADGQIESTDVAIGINMVQTISIIFKGDRVFAVTLCLCSFFSFPHEMKLQRIIDWMKFNDVWGNLTGHVLLR